MNSFHCWLVLPTTPVLCRVNPQCKESTIVGLRMAVYPKAKPFLWSGGVCMGAFGFNSPGRIWYLPGKKGGPGLRKSFKFPRQNRGCFPAAVKGESKRAMNTSFASLGGAAQ